MENRSALFRVMAWCRQAKRTPPEIMLIIFDGILRHYGKIGYNHDDSDRSCMFNDKNNSIRMTNNQIFQWN